MPTKPSGVERTATISSTEELFQKAQTGDKRALSALLRRQGGVLSRWARGRLPRWARSFNDTADLVQEALLQTFLRIDRFDNRGKGAFQAYLRQAVVNRICDEMRRVSRRPSHEPEDAAFDLPADGPSPFDVTLDAEHEQRYKLALKTLSEDERLLVVGRLELGYTYEQLALIGNRPTPEAARQAVRRAVLKVAESIGSD
jgi:RNA polymerase sigma factor (sigma-70 family)